MAISRRTILSIAGLCLSRLVPGQAPDELQHPLFTFHNRLWLNLYHFLYVLGRARNNTPDSTRPAIAGAPPDRDGFASLSADDRARWENAVVICSKTISGKDLIFDAALAAMTRAIAALDDAASDPPDGVDRDVRQALRAAAPVYRRVWWERHSDSNQRHIRELEALVNRFGKAIAQEVSRAYLNQWPTDGFHVEVAAYANWSGAYSTTGGLIVLASTDRATDGTEGLESIFHEAMHQWDDDMERRIGEIAERLKVSVPPSLSHSLIFYTAGYAVAKAIPGHRPYAVANGLWEKGGLFPVEKLDRFWLPYLAGEGTISEALRNLLAA